MNITSESAHASLAQRIAKVRNCMLVEAATGVSVTNKTLFVSLCQIYEQQGIVPSSLPDESPQSPPHQTAENTLPNDIAATSGKDSTPKQHRFGFSVIDQSNLTDWDDWSDWDNDV